MRKTRALLLINRRSRCGQTDLEAITGELKRAGLSLEIVATDSPQSMSELIGNSQHRYECVLIGGGDGTLNAAAKALLASALPVGILPLGTANDLARTLGLPMDPRDACNAITQGRLHRIDLGCVNGRYFFNVAHIGLGVTLARQLSSTIKQQWGILGYARTALSAVRKRSPFQAEILGQDWRYTSRCLQITVGNGRYFGGGIAVAAGARIDDHELDVWSLETYGLQELLALLPAMLRGRHVKDSRIWHKRTRRLEIRTPRRMPVSADGELVTHTPATFHVLPRALAIYVPADYATVADAADTGCNPHQA